MNCISQRILKGRLFYSVLITFNVVFLFALVGCNRNVDIRNKIETMKSFPINLDTSDMLLYNNEFVSDSLVDTSKLKLIIYMDSTECMPCYLKSMVEWKSFDNLIDKYKGQLAFVFILEPKDGTKDQVANHFIDIPKIKMPIYLDKSHLFKSNNKFLPEEKQYHVFLIDENNNVLLVGNPLLNPHVCDIMYKIIDNKLK